MSMSISSASAPRKAGPDGAPLLRLAQRVAKERRPDEAEALLRRARPGTAATSAIDRELARLLQSQRRYGEAERQWRQGVVAAPDDPAALHGLLRVLRLRHRLADAESEVADGSRRWPDSRQLALEAARIAAQREAYPQAVLRAY